MVIKWPFMSHKFSFVFLTKLQKTKSKPEAKKEVFDQIKLLKNTPFENPQRWMGQNTFPILLLNDDNMIHTGQN